MGSPGNAGFENLKWPVAKLGNTVLENNFLLMRTIIN